MSNYANPEVLVTTDWVKANLGKPGIKLVEIDVDTKAYEAGHIPGAIGFNWQTQLQDQVGRDIISKRRSKNCWVTRESHLPTPSSVTVTTTTGSQPMASGCSRFTVTAMPGSWMVDASSG